jgi:hypothetical protein
MKVPLTEAEAALHDIPWASARGKFDDLDEDQSSGERAKRTDSNEAPEQANGERDARSRVAARSTWPEPLSEAALYGLPGEIVRAIEPETEADNAAILLQTLVMFGAIGGRGPHIRVEGDEHHGNLFVLLAGETSKARKGTSWGRVREMFGRVNERVQEQSGLSSGEGLKFAVRDAQGDDAGVSDKRLLVLESEFAQVLRQSGRAGNTLSATLRCAWDSGRLATLTRKDPVVATGAHVCVVGHITVDELRAELTATDSANGFANRFVFMCVRRSKSLPLGGARIPDGTLRNFGERIERAVRAARKTQCVTMTDSAEQTWKRVYPTLSEGYSGLFGAVTGRAEAQCLRMALLYALMDESSVVDRTHLLAAIAIWERAEASARHIFGSALGDPLADEILRALRVAGEASMTRTAIRDLLRRHGRAERIDAALELLARRGLARRCERDATGGRPAEVWKAI